MIRHEDNIDYHISYLMWIYPEKRLSRTKYLIWHKLLWKVVSSTLSRFPLIHNARRVISRSNIPIFIIRFDSLFSASLSFIQSDFLWQNDTYWLLDIDTKQIAFGYFLSRLVILDAHPVDTNLK